MDKDELIIELLKKQNNLTEQLVMLQRQNNEMLRVINNLYIALNSKEIIINTSIKKDDIAKLLEHHKVEYKNLVERQKSENFENSK